MNYKKSFSTLFQVCIIAVILLFVWCLTFYSQNVSERRIERLVYGTQNIGTNVPVGEITNGFRIYQEFPVSQNMIGISILFATYARDNNSGSVSISITGKESGKVLYNKKIPAKNFQDNSFVDFIFDGKSNIKDTCVIADITSDSPPQSGLTIWSTVEDTILNYSLTINSTPSNGDLIYKPIISRSIINMPTASLYLIMVLFSFSAALIIQFLIVNKRNIAVGFHSIHNSYKWTLLLCTYILPLLALIKFMYFGFEIYDAIAWIVSGAMIILCFIKNTEDTKITEVNYEISNNNYGKDSKQCKLNYPVFWIYLVFLGLSYGLLKLISSYSGLINSSIIFYTGVLVFYFAIYHNMGTEKSYRLFIYYYIVAFVWLIVDKTLFVIDEGAHFNIIKYIISKSYFPSVDENYEAVQGPVYYYLLAVFNYMFPESISLYISRALGLLCLILSASVLYRKTITLIREQNIIHVETGLINVIWLLFSITPSILLHLTRVSNESLVCAQGGVIIYLLIRSILLKFDEKELFIATLVAAIAFLTKATSVFLFTGIMIVCIYYKKWKFLIFYIFSYLIFVIPWFICNYLQYHAITGMKGHLAFVLPIVNPNMIPVDVWHTLLHFFDRYFLIFSHFDYFLIDQFVSFLLLLLLALGTKEALLYLYTIIKNKLSFSYSEEEKRKVLFITLITLPISALFLHAITSVMLYVNSLGCNRYFFMLNIDFIVLLLMFVSSLSRQQQKSLTRLLTLLLSFLSVSMLYHISSYL